MSERDELSKDVQEIAQALCEWFISQDVSVGRSITVMAYLVGVSCGQGKDLSAVLNRIKTTTESMAVIALATMEGNCQ